MPGATSSRQGLRRRQLLATAAALVPLHKAGAQGLLASDLLEAAKKEGKVVYYTTDDELMAQVLVKGFQAAYPTITVELQRANAAALLERLESEQKAGPWQADVINTNDVRSLVLFRRNGWLAHYVPANVRQWPEAARDPAGFYAVQSLAVTVIGYNSRLVNPELAPKSYEDLLARRWHDKLVKLHPAESGIGLTTTFLMNRELGWSFWERLAQQGVLHVRSGVDAPAKLVGGERWAMVDGTEEAVLRLRASGAPIMMVHAKEGSPVIPSGTSMFKEAPHPNAARLLVNWLMGRDAQQIVVNAGARSYHPDARDTAERPPLANLKLWQADPILLAAESELIKQIYEQFFPN